MIRAAALSIVDASVPTEHPRPRTRGECVDGPRPCPWISCRHHIVTLRVRPSGRITLDVAEVQLQPTDDQRELEAFADAIASYIAELPTTCTLDAAERDGMTYDEIAKAFRVSKERVRQVLANATQRLLRNAPHLDDDSTESR